MRNICVIFPEDKKIELEDIGVLEIREGEVLIKTLVTQISIGTELTTLSGEFPKGSYWTDYAKYPFKVDAS